jgi:hypothetical protein
MRYKSGWLFLEAESACPFDGFDKLTASKLRAPSRVEGLALAATGD